MICIVIRVIYQASHRLPVDPTLWLVPIYKREATFTFTVPPVRPPRSAVAFLRRVVANTIPAAAYRLISLSLEAWPASDRSSHLPSCKQL